MVVGHDTVGGPSKLPIANPCQAPIITRAPRLTLLTVHFHFKLSALPRLRRMRDLQCHQRGAPPLRCRLLLFEGATAATISAMKPKLWELDNVGRPLAPKPGSPPPPSLRMSCWLSALSSRRYTIVNLQLDSMSRRRLKTRYKRAAEQPGPRAFGAAPKSAP